MAIILIYKKDTKKRINSKLSKP